MLNGIMWQLAWRFGFGKRQNRFISFISASSIAGIALGCFVLILLLSVMNGFERELKKRVLAVIPHAELYAIDHRGMRDWQFSLQRFVQQGDIPVVQAYSKATGMLQKGKRMKAIAVTGLNAIGIQRDPLLSRFAKSSQQALLDNPEGILLGAGVMRQLAVKPGDKVQLLLPQLSDDLKLKAPKSVWLKVLGAVAMGGELDSHMAIMDLARLSEVLGVSYGAQGLRFYFDDPFVAQSRVRVLGALFDQALYVSSWFRTHGHLYQDIQLVRAVVYIALSLMIAVACFNIVSTLVMAVNEKSAEIAMLKTMGATNSLILRTFMLQGLFNGLCGVLVGCSLGTLCALRISQIASWLEQLTGNAFLSGDIYFIDFLPSQLHWQEVALTAVIALALSVLATLYPAKKAAQIAPAQGLL